MSARTRAMVQGAWQLTPEFLWPLMLKDNGAADLPFADERLESLLL